MKKQQIIEDIKRKERNTNIKWNRAILIELISIVAIIPSGFFILLHPLIGAISLGIFASLSIIFAFESGKYRDQNIAMETAIWIARNWVEKEQLDMKFYKYTYSKCDDKYDNALSFLHENYDIDPNPQGAIVELTLY